MNLLLLSEADLLSPDTARVTGRRYRHMVEVLRVEPGQSVRAGLLNGLLGEARVTAVTASAIDLELQLTVPPPPPAPLTLILALPRPKALRRLLQGVASFGIAHLALCNTARVDKSYWQSPFLAADAVHEQLLLGLEQARDTRLPQVTLHPLFRPFVEDQLPQLAAGSLKLVAHPASDAPCPCAVSAPVSLAIGPEGGFVPYEIDRLVAQGFRAVRLGHRPLRVEMALPALLGRLLPP
jgi:RsmE family RNA methyltransferase